jgi:DNA-binding MarR family transcriptional regulator
LFIVKELHNRAWQDLATLSSLVADAREQLLQLRALSRPRAEVVELLHGRAPVTQRDLSEKLRCTPRNVTDLVDALEAARLVARAPHPRDRRATLVSLTGRGKEVATQLDDDAAQLAASVFGEMADDELMVVVTILEWTIGRLNSLR